MHVYILPDINKENMAIVGVSQGGCQTKYFPKHAVNLVMQKAAVPQKFHQMKSPCLQSSDFYLGDLSSEVLVLLRVLQEVHKLHYLQLGLLTTSHILELHFDVVLHHLGC